MKIQAWTSGLQAVEMKEYKLLLCTRESSMSWPQSDFGRLKREKENPAMDNWRFFLIFNAVEMGSFS